jgi:hypothetical protein
MTDLHIDECELNRYRRGRREYSHRDGARSIAIGAGVQFLPEKANVPTMTGDFYIAIEGVAGPHRNSLALTPPYSTESDALPETAFVEPSWCCGLQAPQAIRLVPRAKLRFAA